VIVTVVVVPVAVVVSVRRRHVVTLAASGRIRSPRRHDAGRALRAGNASGGRRCRDVAQGGNGCPPAARRTPGSPCIPKLSVHLLSAR
jgi:hypothetical protein